MIYKILGLANKPYCPSNGTEGMIFQEYFCDKCIYDRHQSCKILAKTMIYDINDPKYPKQWKHNKQGEPMCTAFRDKMVKAKRSKKAKNPNHLQIPLFVKN